MRNIVRCRDCRSAKSRKTR